MDPWKDYGARMEVMGSSRRNAAIHREAAFLRRKIENSPACHELLIDGEPQAAAVINSDNLNIKTICSMPGEDLPHGGIVEWMNNHWLITAKDAGNELYTRATMQQCNYLIRWIADDKRIIERWCIVEDGTKYLTGEFGDNDFILVRGDSRLTLILPRDKETVRLNRDNRFLIDDYGSPNVLAYRLTKPFKLGGTFNGSGILSFVLTECNTEDSDNLELHIANYYDHFPRHKDEYKPPDPPPAYYPSETPNDSSAKKVWL